MKYSHKGRRGIIVLKLSHNDLSEDKRLNDISKFQLFIPVSCILQLETQDFLKGPCMKRNFLRDQQLAASSSNSGR